jgi:hypothetical protein
MEDVLAGSDINPAVVTARLRRGRFDLADAAVVLPCLVVADCDF